MAKLSNPIGFTRGPVTVITTLSYIAILVVLIVVHTSAPPAPRSTTPLRGVNLTEAWHELQLLTSSYHPYNSRENDYIHDWLLLQIESIVTANNASSSRNAAEAFVFNDMTSNLTFSSPAFGSSGGISVYFEGTNIITYIRGEEDDKSRWWEDSTAGPSSRNGVLVNAHFDSVSSGFGATDDGMGVITILQLIKYYTTPGNRPKHGIVLLLNNGEEDFLNGARVFSQHPMAKLVSSFLNLEGAGAGGRATLFRSTDTEITKAYARSPHPFGSVVSADGFQKGLVRSQTDYVVFNGIMGLRGLDVAFVEPRARYHTNQDDTQHTSMASLWHMLSSAIATTKELTARPLSTNLDPEDTPRNPSVWFDMFGIAFIVFRTHTFFSLAVTLLVAGPVVLLVTMIILYRFEKLYLFSSSRKYHMSDGDEIVSLYGWRGFFRFPMVFLFACAAPVALAYLLFTQNEFIAHSSEWAVWSMMISSFVFVAWCACRAADYTRPSSLTRAYGLTWMWGAWWVFLAGATVGEEQVHLAGIYFVLFYAACVFVATWLSYLEMFSLPKKNQYCLEKLGEDVVARSRSLSRARDGAEASDNVRPSEEDEREEEGQEEPTETSGLLGRGRSAYKKYTQSEDQEQPAEHKEENNSKHDEPDWSTKQWSWLWVVQFIVLAPSSIIILGQIALLLVTGLHQTGADGSNMFLVYISIAVFTIFLFSPLVPFIHRLTWHVPMFLFLVLVGTLIYNLVAFPFSPNNRLKLFFLQQVDLDHGNNTVSLLGANDYVQQAISNLPSAAGQQVQCAKNEAFSQRRRCGWEGIFPDVVQSESELPPEGRFQDWITFNVTKLSNDTDTTKARFTVSGQDTRACKILFDSPIRKFKVRGQAPVHDRFPPVPEGGSSEIRLWSRTWNRTWDVDVKADGKLSGRVVCMWSDVNQKGVVPAYDEALHYAPEWVAITKAADGLVEGYKRFAV